MHDFKDVKGNTILSGFILAGGMITAEHGYSIVRTGTDMIYAVAQHYDKDRDEWYTHNAWIRHLDF